MGVQPSDTRVRPRASQLLASGLTTVPAVPVSISSPSLQYCNRHFITVIPVGASVAGTIRVRPSPVGLQGTTRIPALESIPIVAGTPTHIPITGFFDGFEVMVTTAITGGSANVCVNSTYAGIAETVPVPDDYPPGTIPTSAIAWPGHTYNFWRSDGVATNILQGSLPSYGLMDTTSNKLWLLEATNANTLVLNNSTDATVLWTYSTTTNIYSSTPGLVQITGFGSPPSGVGLTLGYTSGIAYVYSFDFGASAYMPIVLEGSTVTFAQGNIGLQTATSGWMAPSSTNYAIACSGAGVFFYQGAIYNCNNLYFDGTNWRYRANGTGCYIKVDSSGFTYVVAASGVAGNIATVVNLFNVPIAANGNAVLQGQFFSQGSGGGHAFNDRVSALTWTLYATGGTCRLFNATNGDVVTADLTGQVKAANYGTTIQNLGTTNTPAINWTTSSIATFATSSGAAATVTMTAPANATGMLFVRITGPASGSTASINWPATVKGSPPTTVLITKSHFLQFAWDGTNYWYIGGAVNA